MILGNPCLSTKKTLYRPNLGQFCSYSYTSNHCEAKTKQWVPRDHHMSNTESSVCFKKPISKITPFSTSSHNSSWPSNISSISKTHDLPWDSFHLVQIEDISLKQSRSVGGSGSLVVKWTSFTSFISRFPPSIPWASRQQLHAVVQWPLSRTPSVLGSVIPVLSQYPHLRPQQPPRFAVSSGSTPERYQSACFLCLVSARLAEVLHIFQGCLTWSIAPYDYPSISNWGI